MADDDDVVSLHTSAHSVSICKLTMGHHPVLQMAQPMVEQPRRRSIFKKYEKEKKNNE